jgi:6,7-dimethyl-8-ribityllumazine synthase
MSVFFEGSVDGSQVRVALVVSRFNDLVTERLLAGALTCLDRLGQPPQERMVLRVPGAWELPLAASSAARSGRVDAVVALGALIRGATPHFDHIATQASAGLAAVSRETGIPVGFGLLTTENVDQALDRAGGKAGNKGAEAAASAVEMVQLLRRMAQGG